MAVNNPTDITQTDEIIMDDGELVVVESETRPRIVRRVHYERRARFGGFQVVLNPEVLLYSAIILLAVFTRFGDLASRALHHDEGVHAYYSWLYYSGDGYVQEPWKHGPFLYHITALSFWLFGANELTARLPAALFGTLTVLLPLFLRKELGRWGAVTASFLLAISPMFLYYSRFIREDIFVAFATLALVVGLMRFIARPGPGWWYAAMGALTLLYCTKAVSFFYTLIFGGFLLLWLCWQLAPRLLFIVGGYALIAFGFFSFIRGLYPLPKVPYEDVSGDAIGRYVNELLFHPVSWTLLVLVVVGAAVIFFSFREVAVQRKRYLIEQEEADPDIKASAALFAPYEVGTLAYAVGWLGRHWRTIALSLVMVFAFYTVLYTGFFSNLVGEAGLIATFFYWSGQQDYARGSQPWFYYFLTLPLYETLAVMFGTSGAIYALVKATMWGFKREKKLVRLPAPPIRQAAVTLDNDDELDDPDGQTPPLMPQVKAAERWIEVEVAVNNRGDRRWPSVRQRNQHPYFFPLFVIVWAATSLFLYSWAGEKMPWLTVQLTLPFILLAGWFIGQGWLQVDRYFATRQHREVIIGPLRGSFFFWLSVCSLFAVGLLAYFVMLVSSKGRPDLNLSARVLGDVNASQANQYQFLLIPLALLILMVGILWLASNWRLAFSTLMLVVFGLMAFFTVRTAFALSYEQADTPYGPGVYTQTSPDVTRVVAEIRNFAMIMPEQNALPILYDSDLMTPLDFYLKDFSKKVKVYGPDGVTETYPADNITKVRVNSWSEADLGKNSIIPNQYALILVAADKRSTLGPQLEKNFIRRTYSFRWNFSEDQYRSAVPAAQRQIQYLTGRTNAVTVRDPATTSIVVQKGEKLTAEKLQTLQGRVLDKLYDGNGGNTGLLNLQLASEAIGRALFNVNDFNRLWRFFMYREQPQAFGSYDFDLYIRRDVAGLYRQYGDLVPRPLNKPQE